MVKKCKSCGDGNLLTSLAVGAAAGAGGLFALGGAVVASLYAGAITTTEEPATTMTAVPMGMRVFLNGFEVDLDEWLRNVRAQKEAAAGSAEELDKFDAACLADPECAAFVTGADQTQANISEEGIT